MEYSREETIDLVSQDLRMARGRLGITSSQAAKRARLSATYYRALERGLVPRSGHVLRKLFSVCRRLDMESVRVAYIDEIGQYANFDMSSGRNIVFLDTLKANVAELEDIECFLSPDTVFGFLESIGFDSTLASRKRADKQMIELLSGAVFSMCLDQDKDFYLMPVKDDPPDVELLVVDRDSFVFTVVRLEITQHGKYSESLFEVIRKKLINRYQKGTILVVVVEKTERVEVVDLNEFIRENNPHGQRLIIISGGGRAGKFVAMPWDEVLSPSPGKVEWMEIDIDQKKRSKGFRGYQGVFFNPSVRYSLLGMPLFVKEVVLSRY